RGPTVAPRKAGHDAPSGVAPLKRPKRAVPDREHRSEVRVELANLARVVPAMERGSDEGDRQHALEAAGKVEVAVLEDVREREDGLEREDAGDGSAEDHDRGEPDREREEELARMEAKRGRYVEVAIGVVHAME